VSVKGRRGYMLATDLKRLPRRPPGINVQLLPNFDPYLMGRSSRDHLFEAMHRSKVTRTAGWISPVLLVDGRVEGVWSHTLSKQKVRVEIKPFESLTPKVVKEAQARAEAMAASLGATLETLKVL
jgi:winged helix DNA-binding protein